MCLCSIGNGSDLDHREYTSCGYICHVTLIFRLFSAGVSMCLAFVVLVMAVFWITETAPDMPISVI